MGTDGDGAVGVLEAEVLGILAHAFEVVFTQKGNVVVLVTETLVFRVALAEGSVDAEVETLDPGEVDAQEAAQVQVLVAVFLLSAVFDGPQRVVARPGNTVGIVTQASVGEGGHAVRGEAVQVVADGGAVGVVQGVGIGHVHARFHVLGNLGGKVHGHIVTDEMVADDGAFLVGVAQAHEVVGVPGTAAEVDVVVLAPAGLQAHVIPVGDNAFLVVLFLHERHEVDVVESAGLSLPGVPVDDIVGRAQHLGYISGPGELLRAAEGDGRFPFLAFLAGNHDDAVRGLGAIGGQGSGILQDAHLLDGLRVDILDVSGEDDAVQDDEGSGGGGVDGLLSAHEDAGVLAQRALFSTDNNAGQTAAEHVGSCSEAHVGDGGVCHLHDVHGAGEVLGAGGTVTDDHHVVQQFLGDPQGDVEAGAVADGLFHIVEADAGNHQDGIRRTADLETSLRVGGDAGGRSFQHDGGADDALAGLIDHRTAYSARLRVGVPA